MKPIFEKQVSGYLVLILLLVGMGFVVNDSFLQGQWLSISTKVWFVMAVADPIVHQFYVWFFWRTELHYSFMSRIFGKRAFIYYATGFSVLIAGRLFFLIALAIANRNSFQLNVVAVYILTAIFLIPGLYTLYSVHRYFGLKRAFGIDHFDESYRNLPFVKEGIFRFTDNGMYTFGFFLFYVPGLLLLSKAAILAAVFGHLYIWVHYSATELPDIKRIYGEKRKIKEAL